MTPASRHGSTVGRHRPALALLLPCAVWLASLASAPAEEAPALPARTLAVLPFYGAGPEPSWLPTALADLLSAALTRVGGVQVVERARLQQVLELGQQEGEWDDALRNSLRDKLKADLVLFGQCKVTGDRLRLSAMVVDAAEGKPKGQTEAQGPLTKLSDLANQLATDLAPAIAGKTRDDWTALRLVPEVALTALEFYSRGQDFLTEANYADALAALHQSASADAKFVWAQLSLGNAYDRLGEPRHALVSFRSALPAAEGVAERLNCARRLIELAEKLGDDKTLLLARQTAAKTLSDALAKEPLMQMTEAELWERHGEDFWHAARLGAAVPGRLLGGTGHAFLPPSERQFADRYGEQAFQFQVLSANIHQALQWRWQLGQFDRSYEWFCRKVLLSRLGCVAGGQTFEPPDDAPATETPRAGLPSPVRVLKDERETLTLSFDDPARREMLCYAPERHRLEYRFGVLAAPRQYVLGVTLTPLSLGDVDGGVPYPELRLVRRPDSEGSPARPVTALEAQHHERFARAAPSDRAALNRAYQRDQFRARQKTYYLPPATSKLWFTVEALDLVPPRRSNPPAQVGGWRLEFKLTHSPTETLLPEWVLKRKPVTSAARTVSLVPVFDMERSEVTLRVNGQAAQGRTVSFPEGEELTVDATSADGRLKTHYTLRPAKGEWVRVPLHAGWQPKHDPAPPIGVCQLMADGLYWNVFSRQGEGVKECDLYVNNSADLEQWSAPRRLALSSTADERPLALLPAPQGKMVLAWQATTKTSFTPPPRPGAGTNNSTAGALQRPVFVNKRDYWVADSRDGVVWSEPKHLTGAVAQSHWFAFAGGLAALSDLRPDLRSGDPEVYLSQDGLDWQPTDWKSSFPAEIRGSLKLCGAGVSSDRSLHLLLVVGRTGRVVWAVTLTGTDWRLMEARLAELTSYQTEITELALTPHGWVIGLKKKLSPRDSKLTRLLWRTADDLRVLPPQPSAIDLANAERHGDQMIAYQLSPSGAGRFWTCPVNELFRPHPEALSKYEAADNDSLYGGRR